MTFPALRDSVSAPWFDGLARGVLLLHRCRECGHVSRPDVASCPACRSDNLTWVPSRGTGCVVAAILDPNPDDPVVLGLVELDEGPWLHVRLLGTSELVPVGTRVTLEIFRPGGGELVPSFRIDGAART